MHISMVDKVARYIWMDSNKNYDVNYTMIQIDSDAEKLRS
jgi:hypothetical protein